MVDSRSKQLVVAKHVYVWCFVLLLIPVIALAVWISFATMATGTHFSRAVALRLEILTAMIIALIAYFRWPWVAFVVSWIVMFMILYGVLPWDEPGIENFFYQSEVCTLRKGF
jgi:uncharacterized BrkB/YihY/UPF0761 family membrane protein